MLVNFSSEPAHTCVHSCLTQSSPLLFRDFIALQFGSALFYSVRFASISTLSLSSPLASPRPRKFEGFRLLVFHLSGGCVRVYVCFARRGAFSSRRIILSICTRCGCNYYPQRCKEHRRIVEHVCSSVSTNLINLTGIFLSDLVCASYPTNDLSSSVCNNRRGWGGGFFL